MRGQGRSSAAREEGSTGLALLPLASGVAYLASSMVAIGFPDVAPLVSRISIPLYFGEFIVVLWLALVGARGRGCCD